MYPRTGTEEFGVTTSYWYSGMLRSILKSATLAGTVILWSFTEEIVTNHSDSENSWPYGTVVLDSLVSNGDTTVPSKDSFVH